jgi:hypothetical protein
LIQRRILPSSIVSPILGISIVFITVLRTYGVFVLYDENGKSGGTPYPA